MKPKIKASEPPVVIIISAEFTGIPVY